MSGKQLFGFFEDNKLSTIDIIKNAESIYYMRNDKNELVGTDKSKSGIIKIWITDNAIDEVRKIKDVDGNVFPEGDFPEKESLLRGFVWRDDERPKSVDDLFKDDPPLELPVIKGLEDYVPQEEFFDEALMQRVKESDQKSSSKQSKASRKIPEKPKTDEKSSKKIKKQQ